MNSNSEITINFLFCTVHFTSFPIFNEWMITYMCPMVMNYFQLNYSIFNRSEFFSVIVSLWIFTRIFCWWNHMRTFSVCDVRYQRTNKYDSVTLASLLPHRIFPLIRIRYTAMDIIFQIVVFISEFRIFF